MSADNYGNGVIAADLIGESLNGKGKIGVVYYDVDFFVTNQRLEAFEATMASKYPDIEIVSEMGFQDTNGCDVDDEDTFLIKFKNGAVGSIEATRNAWGRNNYITVEVHGTEGTVCFNYERLNELEVCWAKDPDDRRGFKTIYTGPAHFYGDATWNIPGMNIGYGELKAIEMFDFITAIVKEEQPSTNFKVGCRVEKVCHAVAKSAKTNQWEKVVD